MDPDVRLTLDIVKGIEYSSVEALKKGGLTADQLQFVKNRISKMAIDAENRFGNHADISDKSIREYITNQFVSLVTEIAQITAQQPPNLYIAAGLSEAVFSHKGDVRPLLVTDCLATCIGVAGYDPKNQFGFVIHFTHPDEIKNSGAMLIKIIKDYRESSKDSPLLIHFRGGIKEMSESLLEDVKNWLTSSGIPYIIASEDVMQTSIAPGIGLPKELPSSIKLDVRTGSVEPYDSRQNPYRTDLQIKPEDPDFKELNPDSIIEKLIQMRKPEIKVVYQSKESQ